MRNSSLRLNMTKILSNLQVLYQNQQISADEKNHIVKLLKNGLSGNACNEAVSCLNKLKRSVGQEFKDTVYDCIQMIDIK